MTDRALIELAEAAGLLPVWRDVRSDDRHVSPDTLRSLLGTLGLPAGSEAQIAESFNALMMASGRLPAMVTMTTGPEGVAIPGCRPGEAFTLTLEDGTRTGGVLDQGWGGEARLPTVDQVGYHRLEAGDGTTLVAAAPPRCHGLPGHERAWGFAAQVYSLRRSGDFGMGDHGGVLALGQAAAARGADCIAISPLHALFAADPHRYGPYAPSSRLFLNALHADASLVFADEVAPEAPASDLIEWPGAAVRKQAYLRGLFTRHGADPRFAAWRTAQGWRLEGHARFEALQAHLLSRDPNAHDWRRWRGGLDDPDSAAVGEFALGHAEEVAFHAFCQFVASTSLIAAQRGLMAAGMRIGMIADLAIGTDGAGSQAWSRQDETLQGPSIGAPPDIFSPLGQDWGLTAFSPAALSATGYGAFLEVLRAALRHAGGVRIDHVMGLSRLWLVPPGAAAAEGAYLRYPVGDLLRLLALESHRHQAVVIGEDLGTVPEGFRERLDAAGVMGMRVLWFERDQAGRFIEPAHWSANAVAMTTTHDLPTAAGWWQGRDIDWRERLNLFPEEAAVREARQDRTGDRTLLWRGMVESGAAEGDPPDEGAGAMVADAAVQHTGGSACTLGILPLEDALGLSEQPNLPGTVTGHPNWQRRLPGDAATLLDAPDVAARVARFAATRRGRAGV